MIPLKNRWGRSKAAHFRSLLPASSHTASHYCVFHLDFFTFVHKPVLKTLQQNKSFYYLGNSVACRGIPVGILIFPVEHECWPSRNCIYLFYKISDVCYPGCLQASLKNIFLARIRGVAGMGTTAVKKTRAFPNWSLQSSKEAKH